MNGRKMALASIALMAALFIACDESSPRVAPEPSPTQTAPVTDSASPAPGRTGIPEVDAVIETLFTGDEEAVRALIRFTAVECEDEPVGLGAPPQCPEGVADGTPVDVLPWASCEGTYLFPEAIDGTVTTLSEPGATLAAVYEAGGKVWPPGRYVAVFSGVGAPRRADIAYAVSITDGRVVGIHAGCGMTPEEYAEFFGLADALLVVPTPTP